MCPNLRAGLRRTEAMTETAGAVAAGVPHHVTQRGGNQCRVLLDDDDRRFYLWTLARHHSHLWEEPAEMTTATRKSATSARPLGTDAFTVLPARNSAATSVPATPRGRE